ncbi:unnamed protein product [Acanthosepion pharaonis]|uniref:Uncharacterized protein n=1 Tax=Acanthosepion pharaonis TaxID=158019 RepID=A0A812CFV4_ACAPH|nr:unnamed protein product [Sepia pharaonis]
MAFIYIYFCRLLISFLSVIEFVFLLFSSSFFISLVDNFDCEDSKLELFSLCYFYPFFLSLFSNWSSFSLSSHFCIDNHSLLCFFRLLSLFTHSDAFYISFSLSIYIFYFFLSLSLFPIPHSHIFHYLFSYPPSPPLFIKWCQRSLNQLQKEIVDFTVVRWPPIELELQSEFHLQDSNLRSIAGSDKDRHVFVFVGDDKSIKELGETGEFVGQCPLGNEDFFPQDICCPSQDNFVNLSTSPSKFYPSLPPSPLNCFSFFSLSSPPPATFPSLYICLCFSMPSKSAIFR